MFLRFCPFLLNFRVSKLVSSKWPRGVTVSTLGSASSDSGSNPRDAFVLSRFSAARREEEREERMVMYLQPGGSLQL